MKFGLFLNAGEFPGQSHSNIFDLMLAEATLADELGYHDLWLTEHHFIPFGVNPSSLAAAGFLLGRTRNVRVGTAVVLAPLYHPVQIAEQAAVLDQLSGGRFDLGIGRGGYLREFEVFGVPIERYSREVDASIAAILDAWDGRPLPNHDGSPFEHPATMNPRPRSSPRPNLFVASSSPGSVSLAAKQGLPLLNYFATPVDGRVQLRDAYAAAARDHGVDPDGVEHVQALVCVVSDEPEAELRARLRRNIEHSYENGDWPHVPQAGGRHSGPDGTPRGHAELAAMTVEAAAIGTPERVIEQLTRFIEATGTARMTLFMEMTADPAATLASVRAFATDVAPALHDRFG